MRTPTNMILRWAMCFAGTVWLWGCSSGQPQQPAARLLEVRAPAEVPNAGERPADAINVEGKWWVASTLLADDSDVTDAWLVMEGTRRQVQFDLNDAAADRVRQHTSQSREQPLLFYVRGKLVDAPVVQGTIARRLTLMGLRASMSENELAALAADLRPGSR